MKMHPSMFRGPTDDELKGALRFAGCSIAFVLLAAFSLGFLVARIAR